MLRDRHVPLNLAKSASRGSHGTALYVVTVYTHGIMMNGRIIGVCFMHNYANVSAALKFFEKKTSE